MISNEENIETPLWPSLSEAHGQGGRVDTASADNPAAAANDGWEFVVQEDDEDAVELEFVPPGMRTLRHCSSSPDLRFIGRALAAVAEDEDDVTLDSQDESSGILVDTVPPATSINFKSSYPVNRIPSFKDMLLLAKETQKKRDEVIRQTPKKLKAKIVVTPIKRCARSTGDLQSLITHEAVVGDEILGETDAMEYYHRKAHGHGSHKNSLKIRPDEAKRKTMIMQKKNMQRQQQANRG